MKKLLFMLMVATVGYADLSASALPHADEPLSFQGHSGPLTDTLRMAFEHKQSAIVHTYQLKVLDSVVLILNRNPGITLSIEGYSYVDEGNDTICKYLSLNRALFIQDAMLGRGIDSSRITGLKAMGAWKPVKRGQYKVINEMPYRT